MMIQQSEVKGAQELSLYTLELPFSSANPSTYILLKGNLGMLAETRRCQPREKHSSRNYGTIARREIQNGSAIRSKYFSSMLLVLARLVASVLKITQSFNKLTLKDKI